MQVCYGINADNLQREIDGLMDALHFFNLKQGYIITLNQTDVYRKEGKEIKLMPINELLLEEN